MAGSTGPTYCDGGTQEAEVSVPIFLCAHAAAGAEGLADIWSTAVRHPGRHLRQRLDRRERQAGNTHRLPVVCGCGRANGRLANAFIIGDTF